LAGKAVLHPRQAGRMRRAVMPRPGLLLEDFGDGRDGAE
jgi:hypothetical protein